MKSALHFILSAFRFNPVALLVVAVACPELRVVALVLFLPSVALFLWLMWPKQPADPWESVKLTSAPRVGFQEDEDELLGVSDPRKPRK